MDNPIRFDVEYSLGLVSSNSNAALGIKLDAGLAGLRNGVVLLRRGFAWLRHYKHVEVGFRSGELDKLADELEPLADVTKNALGAFARRFTLELECPAPFLLAGCIFGAALVTPERTLCDELDGVLLRLECFSGRYEFPGPMGRTPENGYFRSKGSE